MKKILCTVLAAALTLSLSVSACAKGLSGTVSTNGSTSMEKVIGILSEQFMEDNDGVTITYDATGSGTGIEAAANGTCDIGLASRALKDVETEKGLVATTVALDGIAIIVIADCPVDDLTVEQIADIFTGKVTSWADFGGKGDIACIGREAGSGTRDGFESITGTKDTCVLAQELTSTGAVIAAIKVLTVGGVACTEETVLDGSYVVQRPFNLVTMEGAQLSEAAKAFFDYMVSADAADLIAKAGAVPTVLAEAEAETEAATEGVK